MRTGSRPSVVNSNDLHGATLGSKEKMITGSRTPTPVQSEIERLLRAAGECGEIDAYTGKRDVVRVAEGLQLEVTTDRQDVSAAWAVTMHNVSGGGIAFWSRRDIAERTAIYVREFSPDTPHSWIPALVKHSTRGIRGHLIGASFDKTNGSISTPTPPV